MKVLYIFCMFIFLLGINASCNKSKPQLPSNKTNSVQSDIEMNIVNKKLVEKEDSLLSVYIKNHETDFQKNDAGFYYKIIQSSEGDFLKNNDICNISYRIYLLDGSLVEEISNLTVIIGKHETLKGIDLGLTLMKKGERAVFVFPWSLAYGLLGDGIAIPPYTSLKVELSVENTSNLIVFS